MSELFSVADRIYGAAWGVIFCRVIMPEKSGMHVLIIYTAGTVLGELIVHYLWP